MAVATMPGTEKLFERIGKPDMIPNRTVESVLELIRELNVEVLQWRQFGQSEVDGIYGQLQVVPQEAGHAIQRLLDLKMEQGLMNYEVAAHPVGITRPAAVTIDVRAGSALR